jgi:predicted kinase
MKKRPTLYIFSGLPGVGKTTLGKKLASHLNSAFLRIDTVEQALRDFCSFKVEGEGYRLSYRVAKDNLQIGNDVASLLDSSRLRMN